MPPDQSTVVSVIGRTIATDFLIRTSEVLDEMVEVYTAAFLAEVTESAGELSLLPTILLSDFVQDQLYDLLRKKGEDPSDPSTGALLEINEEMKKKLLEAGWDRKRVRLVSRDMDFLARLTIEP